MSSRDAIVLATLVGCAMSAGCASNSHKTASHESASASHKSAYTSTESTPAGSGRTSSGSAPTPPTPSSAPPATTDCGPWSTRDDNRAVPHLKVSGAVSCATAKAVMTGYFQQINGYAPVPLTVQGWNCSSNALTNDATLHITCTQGSDTIDLQAVR